MPRYGPDKIRNVAVLGHSHDGKTTLAEAMLFTAGAQARMGSTDAGSSVLDFEPEEHKRRISINLGLGHLEHEGFKVNLLDSPGFLDFAGQVRSALTAADGALLVVSPNQQLAVGTEVAWQQLGRSQKPRLVVVNKMDKENADFFGALDAMRAQLNPRPVALHVPIGAEASFRGVVDLMRMKAYVASPDGKGGEAPIPDDMRSLVDERREQLVEAAAEGDDTLLEKYLDEGTLSDEEVERGLRAGIAEGKVCPVVCCSASKQLGVRTLIRALCDLLPGPQVDASGPPRSLVFNTYSDPFGRVSYFKVLSGCLKSDQTVPNVTRGINERLGQLFFPQGKEHVNTQEVCAGDIGGATKLQSTLTNDVLGSRDGTVPQVEQPPPAYHLAITPKARGDEDKISHGLARLAEEDPTLRVERNDETRQMIIGGMGDVHLDVILEKLKRKYGAEATTELPRVAYRETIASSARAEGRHVKQSGGHGQYGVCVIEVSPTARGEGFVWEDKIFGGSVPQNYRPSVQKGIVDTMAKGVVAGYTMVDVKVSLVDGKYHTVDSSDMAFQIAGSLAIRKAAAEANPVLLEPVHEVEVRVPERYLGDIMSDLNGKRGRIAGTEPDSGWQVVRAMVPESEMQRLALDLRSITQGRGSFVSHFSHYEDVPAHIARSLIEAYQKEHSGKE
ncbi:MAG: elongation factor G [Candidatus Nephthysia bennettiae]|uniref:Elongation factor G n=1 Tax=Candidatus Nephthysia bennettiae TaxID=3127016 RepID=A0A934NAX7_9BACT|nr:elongation factor G [Candidatus Dormibacteraeota bacterium]MBJ7612828.1 elongation factor G [Candidatus Dormibacteraeota bacterium]PZR90913.1 MAG: elongation factor G [Candidatus Dormibacteraeota bacterium]